MCFSTNFFYTGQECKHQLCTRTLSFIENCVFVDGKIVRCKISLIFFFVVLLIKRHLSNSCVYWLPIWPGTTNTDYYYYFD